MPAVPDQQSPFDQASLFYDSLSAAEQRDLACRPVVLKVSATEGTEHQTLARLQHTNIVPIFSVHEDQEAGLRAVCMPYFGGATLASVLERLWDGQAPPAQAPGRLQYNTAMASNRLRLIMDS